MTATGATAWRRFSRVFLAGFVLGGSGMLVLGGLPNAARCRPTAVPDTFVGACRGVGYDEGALTVLRRAGTYTRPAIVNEDSFFTERLSMPATRIRDEPWRTWLAALGPRGARSMLDLGAASCARVPLGLLPRAASAIHRVRGDGNLA